ncbi:MAG: TetR/AcrR family transcriptional regulator [Proteobacteria bacterium]|nr:TetR/AcrR family transcriptional regulator [Pseudomonadota bacterium]
MPTTSLTARRSQPLSHAERSAATQAQILDAGMRVMRAGSFRAATMFEVAKAAGVTPGALQHHFGSKAELMMHLLERAIGSIPDRDADHAWPKPADSLSRRASGFVQALWAHSYEPPRFLVAWGIYFGSAGDADVLKRVVEMRARLRLKLHRRFIRTFPELADAPRLEAFIDLVLSSLRGMGVVRLFGPAPTSSAAQLAELAAVIEWRCRQPSGTTNKKPRKSKRLVKGRAT